MTGYESKRAAAQEKLAQPAQEPVAWMHVQGDYEEPSWHQLDDDEIEMGWKQYPLYTAPSQRPWVGLTDEERKPLIQQAMMYYGYNKEYWLQTSGAGFCLLVQAIEAKLKERNA